MSALRVRSLRKSRPQAAPSSSSSTGHELPGQSHGVRWQRYWESLCRRCGQCCYVRRLTPSGLHIDTSAPCRFLDRSGRSCTVYRDRFRVCRDCKKLTLVHALFSPYLPDDCGYVQAYRVSQVLDRAIARLLTGLLKTEGIGAKALRR